jgi:Na+/glutamate symporter
MLVGLLIGIVIGLVIGPVIRSWLAWREYVEASREARLHDEVLRRMDRSPDTGREDVPRSIGSG